MLNGVLRSHLVLRSYDRYEGKIVRWVGLGGSVHKSPCAYLFDFSEYRYQQRALAFWDFRHHFYWHVFELINNFSFLLYILEVRKQASDWIYLCMYYG
jgi:hypothetical protein